MMDTILFEDSHQSAGKGTEIMLSMQGRMAYARTGSTASILADSVVAFELEHRSIPRPRLLIGDTPAILARRTKGTIL
jgi:hypothetical protein